MIYSILYFQYLFDGIAQDLIVQRDEDNAYSSTSHGMGCAAVIWITSRPNMADKTMFLMNRSLIEHFQLYMYIQ